MAEFTNGTIQTVQAGASAVFTEERVSCCDIITHRANSSVIKLFPINGKCFTRFKVTFSANLGAPAGSALPQPLSVALSIDGEPDAITTSVVTPATADTYFNVSSTAYIYVRHGCCTTIGLRNTSAIPINVHNANIIVTRE